ncbi:MAG: hypothetical protein IIW48_09485 [Clostridia bacterium]|nr:hypothetical protein [Clostridia bacterium]
MKCPSCGAESQGKFCEYCGSEMPQEKATINITNNYYDSAAPQEQTDVDNTIGKCPKCGNSKIAFKRERVGTATQSRSRKNYIGTGRQGKSVSQSAYRTVGVCQNCGYTWNPNATNKGSGKKTWLWVLGWICIFPLPLTILLLRKKDMKPAIKYGIIAVAWVLFFVIGLFGNGGTDATPTDTHPSYTESVQGDYTTNNEISDTTNETVSLDVILNNYIADAVSNYNSQATEQLVFVEDFKPSDKENGHYRTEFRLTAYKDAVGKSYILGDKVVDIIASKTIFDEINCRVYTNDTSLDQVVALLKGFSPILDEELTADELQKTLDEVSNKKTANGYYFGELGITLFGSDDKGYELMLKND